MTECNDLCACPGAPRTCHLCGASRVEEFEGFPPLRRVTSDCRPWPAGGRLALCKDCGAVQKLTDAQWRREIAEIYASYAIYHQGGGLEQAVFDQSTGGAQSRSSRILSVLRDHVQLAETGRMLDVGCGNGAMLRAFAQFAPRWSMAGTDLDDRYSTTIAEINGAEPLYTCGPDGVPGEFDFITMIHVLEHIPEPRPFLESLLAKLTPGGILLVEVPHHRANPFELLIADHCTHFTAPTATRLLETAGLRVLVAADDWAPKELTITAQKAGGGARSPALRKAALPRATGQPSTRRILEHSLNWLASLAAQARRLAAAGPLGLFGSSIAATWLFGELDGRVEAFFDEDPHRVGNTCLGRPILHPHQAAPGTQLLIPLPAGIAEAVSRRIARHGLTIHLPAE